MGRSYGFSILLMHDGLWMEFAAQKNEVYEMVRLPSLTEISRWNF